MPEYEIITRQDKVVAVRWQLFHINGFLWGGGGGGVTWFPPQLYLSRLDLLELRRQQGTILYLFINSGESFNPKQQLQQHNSDPVIHIGVPEYEIITRQDKVAAVRWQLFHINGFL